MLDDRVTISLVIESSDVRPALLTEKLGTIPDRDWEIGQLRGRTGKHWDINGWVVEITLRSEDNGGASANDLLPITLARFETKIRRFKEEVASLGASAQRYVVLSILAQEIPGVELGATFITLLSEIGCSFQVDLH